MEISELGEFGFIDHITRREEIKNISTATAIGDDAAVLEFGENECVVSTDLMVEGLDFDLTYYPLKHLGYRAVVVGASDICAMNAKPSQILISLAISAKFTVEMIDEFYEGVNIAAKEYGIDVVGGDTSASVTGFTIAITTIGSAKKESITYRSGAAKGDLICISGDVGSAYMGLKLLEREKKVLTGNTVTQPEFGDYKYLLQRALKPMLRSDVVTLLKENGIKPTSMIDVSDGIASEILHICKKSELGAKIYIEKLPIYIKTHEAGEELGIDPIIASMNGGGDYELLFTLPLSNYEKIKEIEGITVIGHTCKKEEGVMLVTKEANELTIKAQGHK